jgi:NAD-dependent DNA ligase
MKKDTTLSPSRLVSKYLSASFAYYCLDRSIIEDDEYDAICKELYENFGMIEHPHKRFLDKSALKAGTAYHLKFEDYPTIVRSCAYNILGLDFNAMENEHYEWPFRYIKVKYDKDGVMVPGSAVIEDQPHPGYRKDMDDGTQPAIKE